MDNNTMIVTAVAVSLLTCVILYFVVGAAVRSGTKDLLSAVQKLVALKTSEAKEKHSAPSQNSIPALKKLLDAGMISQQEYDDALASRH